MAKTGLTRSSYFVVVALVIASCATVPRPRDDAARRAAPQPSTTRSAYFGDLHLHTSFSFDAYMGRGSRVTPDMAFRFARGEPVSVFGHTIKRGWPLDFLAVTDHAENLGVGSTIQDPDSRLSRSDHGRQLRSAVSYEAALPVILQTYGVDIDPETSAAAWAEEVAAANRNYEPGVFTTLIGFEWASEEIDGAKTARAVHRNVIFAGAEAPRPFTSLQSKKAEDLWAYMEAARARGMDSIAINNHPVGSDGLAFALTDSSGRLLDRDYAARRNRNERLTEIVNTRTDHESTPEVSPADPLLDLRGPSNPAGPGGTVRGGLGRGLAVRDDLGINPFHVGFVGSSDSHIGLSVSGPASFVLSTSAAASSASVIGAAGRFSVLDAAGRVDWPSTFDVLPGPLTGVWAEENTRRSIFAALKRREVFATSGPRIKVRFFGGWNYRTAPHAQRNWLADAYSHGTPMGGVLPPNPARQIPPRFLIWAQGAPGGSQLSQAQVIKLSHADGRIREQIFDVPTRESGQVSKDRVLRALWEDPEFDPDVTAVYYLRVLEAPTRRWTTIFGRYADLNPSPDWTRTTQQRAWSSPIWYCGDALGAAKARDVPRLDPC